MNFISALACRIYQKILYCGSPLLAWRTPQPIRIENGLEELAQVLAQHGVRRPLLAHGKTVGKLGLAQPLIAACERLGIEVVEYGDVTPDPSVETVEQARQLFCARNCDAIVALGGGSPIDCAKAVAARLARPRKSLARMRGVLKVRRRNVPIYAIPTTSGSGSEATLATVVSNPISNEKYPISDPVLIPDYVVWDASLTQTLPPDVTAQTGIDALTHAIEAYIGRSNTRHTRNMAVRAVKLIFRYLPIAYEHPDDLQARAAMQEASYCAGVAFTRAYVGYAHAVAHTLGGYYHMPHGLANAIALPYVLDWSLPKAYRSLAELAKYAGVCEVTDKRKVAARKMIEAVRALCRRMQLPEHASCIDPSEIPEMARRAAREANPLYPVPRLMTRKDLARLYRVIAGSEPNPWQQTIE